MVAPQQVSGEKGMYQDVTYLHQAGLMTRVDSKRSRPISLRQLKSQGIPFAGCHLVDQAGFFGMARRAKRKHLHPDLRRSLDARYGRGYTRELAQKMFQVRGVYNVVTANLFANGGRAVEQRFHEGRAYCF